MEHFNLENAGFMTKAIHAGQKPDPAYGALATPIYQTSTFCFETVEEGTAQFAGQRKGYAYSRGGNPTVRALELKLAALEGGEDCIATASGMGAVGSVVLGLVKAGDHVIVGDCVYGCTNVAIRDMLPEFGVEVTPVDTSDLEAIRAAITPKTKMIYFETPTNPMMNLTDIAGVRAVVGDQPIKIVVDNTFAPAPIQYPLALGADISLHSATKYLNGHGDVIGGCIIGSAEDIALLRTYAVTKLTGSTCSPFNAFLMLRGLQTLGIRVRRHCESAMRVAEFLEASPYIENVYYAGLESSPYPELAKRQMNGLYTGILSFELKNGIKSMSGAEAGKKLINSMKLAHIAVSLGDPASLIEHPATMTHNNVSAEVKKSMGITDGLIRFSVGLEDVEDIIADFKQAFAALAE